MTKIKNIVFHLLTSSVVVVLAIGTIFYHLVEKWSIMDSLYFSVTTLTTVGFGDLFPTTSISKIFTMIYIVVGIGILFAFIHELSKRRLTKILTEKLFSQKRNKN